MAWIEITTYWLTYNTKKKQCHVGIRYREGGTPDGKILKKTLAVDPGTAVYLADMLRNEKPVYFDPETGAVATGREEVGDEES